MIVDYPDILPYPHFTSTGIKQQSNILRSELASGRVRQRRKFLNVPAEQTIEWRLKSNEAATFLGWVEYALGGGISWFTLNQRTELGVVPVQLRMTAHPLENAKQQGERFIYSVKCEIRKYPIPTQAQTVEQFLMPHTIDEFRQHLSVNQYYTKSWQ